MWICKECENENDIGDSECAACGEQKPVSKFNGFKIGKVLTCEAIPKTKFTYLEIDVGQESPIPVVTSAKNVKKVNQLVVVATIGATFEDKGEEIKVEKSTVGGKRSEGILCDSVMLGWKGGAKDVAVILPDDFSIGNEPPTERPDNRQ